MASRRVNDGGISVVLGGGGSRGPSLLGFLDYLDSEGVEYNDFTGVSIGSVVAAFWTNGYSVEDIKQVFRDELFNSGLDMWFKCLVPPLNPLRWIGLGMVDPLPVMRELVEKYELKPNRKLRMVAFDLITRKPVVFEGKNYDLVTALAASCSVPGMLRPVTAWVDGHYCLLVDGGLHHPQPGHYAKAPAIIAKLIDMPFMELIFPDRRGDFVASVGDPYAPFFSRLSDDDIERLYQHGLACARRDLQSSIRKGLIPVRAQMVG